MSDDREKRIEERAREVRRQEGRVHGRDPDALDPRSLDGEEADMVEANRAMNAQAPGRSDDKGDADLATGEAAAAMRLNSSDHPKHAAREGRAPSLPDDDGRS